VLFIFIQSVIQLCGTAKQTSEVDIEELHILLFIRDGGVSSGIFILRCFTWLADVSCYSVNVSDDSCMQSTASSRLNHVKLKGTALGCNHNTLWVIMETGPFTDGTLTSTECTGSSIP
jgi:hypothetical protein